MAETTVDVDALYAALEQKRSKLRMSWRDVANEIGTSPSTFSRMAQGGRPDIDTFAALLRWLSMSSEEFTRPAKRSTKPTEPLAMISSHLRARKDIRTEDVAAFEEIMAAAYRQLIDKKKGQK